MWDKLIYYFTKIDIFIHSVKVSCSYIWLALAGFGFLALAGISWVDFGFIYFLLWDKIMYSGKTTNLLRCVFDFFNSKLLFG